MSRKYTLATAVSREEHDDVFDFARAIGTNVSDLVREAVRGWVAAYRTSEAPKGVQQEPPCTSTGKT